MSSIKRDQDILSYRPSIEYHKKIETPSVVSSDSTPVSSSGETAYTQTLQDFLTYMPYKVMSSINDSRVLIKEKIFYLGQNLSQQEGANLPLPFQQFDTLLQTPQLKVDELEKLDQYLDHHLHSIEGVYGVEVYYHMVRALNQLDRIQEGYEWYAYGNQGLTPSRQEEEKVYEHTLQEIELGKQVRTINYASLSVDAQMGRTVSDLSHSLQTFALELYNSYIFPNDAPTVDTGVEVKRILDMFEELQLSCESDANKLEFYYNRLLFETLISKIKKQRQQMVSILKERDKLEIAAQSDEYIRSYVKLQSEEVFSGLAELIRFSRSLSMYLGDLSATTQEKDIFRQIYNNLV